MKNKRDEYLNRQTDNEESQEEEMIKDKVSVLDKEKTKNGRAYAISKSKLSVCALCCVCTNVKSQLS